MLDTSTPFDAPRPAPAADRVSRTPVTEPIGLTELAARGRRRRVRRGARLEPGSGLSVVLKGVACLTDVDTGLCLAMIRPGGALGPLMMDGRALHTGLWLTDGEVLDLLPSDLGPLRPDVFEAVRTAATRSHCAALAAELICSRRHQAAPRLARWVLDLCDNEAHAVAILDQMTLATLSGMQRTSVCAVMSRLQRTGGLKVVRGKVTLRNMDALAEIACRCGESITPMAPFQPHPA